MCLIRAAASDGLSMTRRITDPERVPPPSPADQIRFLTNLQRLLSESLFTATYKYALLSALADLSIERSEGSEGGPLLLTTSALAEKFIEYYWRHAAPYATAASAMVLRQNTGAQAKVIALVIEARRRYAGSLAEAMQDPSLWRRLTKSVEAVVKEQPLWKLQTIGREKFEFLYGPGPESDRIELRPGIAYCFRQFYTFVQDAVRSAWLRDVRSLNSAVLGECSISESFFLVRSALPLMPSGRCWPIFSAALVSTAGIQSGAKAGRWITSFLGRNIRLISRTILFWRTRGATTERRTALRM